MVVKGTATVRLVYTLTVSAFMLLASLVMLFPFAWMLSGSLKTDQEIVQGLTTLIPTEFHFSNYPEAMSVASFPIYFLNSTVVAVLKTMATALLCSLAGYALARLSFPGNRVIFILILVCYMIPMQPILIPLFLITKNLPLLGGNNLLGQGGTGGLNSYFGLVVPTLPLAWGTFLLRQFFSTIPRDFDQAARIDGATNVAIYLRIIIPLSGAALATLSVFTFQWGWNEFLWPLVITKSEHMKTVQIGLAYFQMQHRTNWAYLMAAATLSTMPMIAVFLSAQRYFVSGIAITGLKA